MFLADASTAQSHAGDHQRGIVLLSPVDAVGKLVVHVDAVHLCSGHIALCRPGFSPIEGDGSTTIVSQQEVVWIFWVDPQVVVVAVRAIDIFKGFSSVNRYQERRTLYVHFVFVYWICKHFDIVPSTLG